MNIAIIGYGKMGKIIEKIALSRGHNIVAKSNREFPIERIDFSNVDVAIEFTTPELAVDHIEFCVRKNVPIVVGTTSWSEQLPQVEKFVASFNGTLIHASNFSIGVNIFFDVNRRLAQLMAGHHEYVAEIKEIHHLQKLDAPSGTAISIANDILFENPNWSSWVHSEEHSPEVKKGQIGVTSYRKDEVPGTHIIEYKSEIDEIQLVHIAHNRRGFAMGAVVAAEWVIGKRGVFTMQDVIKF